MTQITEKLRENIFRSSRRNKVSLVYFGCAAGFFGLYFFLDKNLFTLTMFTGMFLTGISEALPEGRNVLAGVLRITAVIIYLSILAFSFLRPEAVI
ncbi:MAG: hypothetical protein H8Z69_04955 [Nanohaloarchaea archaeon]|nr:hypothetical protein [Candidatus Nanohaloarchaea archaeon]